MKIALISDLHYSKYPNGALPERKGHLGAELLSRAISKFNKHIRPDLVIFCGDLLESPEETDLLEPSAKLFAQLEAPSIIIPGNHDPASEVFFRAIPRPPEYLDFGHIRFIPFCDRENIPDCNTKRSTEEIARMKKLAETFPGKIVSIQHVPLCPEGSSVSPYSYVNAAEILSACPNLSATICGHYHPGDIVRLRGFSSVIAPAICEDDFPYLLIEFDGDGNVAGIVRESLQDEERSC